MAHHARRQVIARLHEARRRQAERHVDDPVLDRAVLTHHDHERAARAEADELDVPQLFVGPRRHDQGGAMRQPAQQARGLLQHLVGAEAGRLALRFDVRTLVARQVADFQDAVDEQPQPRLRRQPARRGVRRIQQPQLLEIRHDIADRRRRQVQA
jgi:hypothetical protein